MFRLDITPEQAQSLAEALSRAADASLFHPSIVEPIAAGVEGTSAYRAEEYVAAESLDVALRHYAPAAIEKALPFITQLAGAIDFARAAGIGHGALHPRDIFVTPDEARATGFGVVESLEKVGLRAPVRRPYSAPERVEGAAWTTAADVFSLAAIAYELLTARRPAGAGDRIAALPEDMPNGAGIHQVLARAMSDRPEERYLTALAFASALEAAARGERVSGPIATVAAVAAAEPEVARAPLAPVQPVQPVQSVTEAPSREAQDVAITTPAEEEPKLFAADVEKPGRFTHLDDEAVLTAADVLPPALGEAGRPHAPAADVPLRDTVRLSEEDLIREDPGAFADERPIIDDSSSTAADDLSREPPRTSAAAYTGDSAESAAESPRVSVASTGEDLRGYPRASEAYPRASVESGDYPRAPAESPSDYLRESAESASERPRPAVLPLALTAVLCLLLGFAAGYAVGGRDRRTAGTSQAAATQPAAPAATAPAGKQWSEQTVKPSASAQPPSEAPPVPGDAPAAGGVRSTPETTKPRTEALPTSGTLTIRSTPPGAAVTLNGRWRGRTPLTLENLPFARYVVRVVQPGYAVEREEVALSRTDASRALSVRMRPDRAAAPARSGVPARGSAGPSGQATRPQALTGTLFVASNPPGARVFVDGKPFGTAPVRIPDVHIGAHVVRMELPDHRTWSTSTRIVAGQDVRVTGSLERIR